MKAILAVMALLVLAVATDSRQTSTEPDLVYFESGNALLDNCTSQPGTPASFFCYGYVEGIADVFGVLQTQNVCLRVGVDSKQLRDVVIQYLNSHPEQRDAPAEPLVWQAFHEKFGCKASP